MKNRIGIIGGDGRNVELVKQLAEKQEIYIYGIDKIEEFKDIKNIQISSDLVTFLESINTIITSFPITRDGIHLYVEYSDIKITLEEFFNKILNTDMKIYTGNIPQNIEELIKKNNSNIEIIDILKLEEFAIKNSVATAEGTLAIAIQEYKKNLQESNILILGYGRIAKTVANKFKYLSKSVTCASNKDEEFHWIRTNGFNAIHLDELKNCINEYDIIINTIPFVILNKSELENIKKDTLIIDVASNPGGINKEEAEKQNIKYIHALGIPGKVSPISSAQIIKDIIK